MKYLKIIHYTILLSLGGAVIPVTFALIDMWQLQLATTIANLKDVMESQNIYLFSLIIFPVVNNVLYWLYRRIKKSNHSLEQESNYQKNLLNANPDGVVILDKSMNLIFCNDSFKYIFTSIQQILDNSELRNTIPVVSFFQKEFKLDSNFMQNHPFLVSFKQTVYNEQVNYYLSFKDIKDIKDQEEIIKDQNRQMIEKNKLASLGEMAAGIAHEINNPLTVISSNASLLRKLNERGKLSEEKLTELNKKTQQQVERITTIIKSLRSLSHGMANDQMENFSLHELLQESINLARMKDKSKKIVFSLENTTDFAFGNRGQIVQVILNLLNNAIDAIEEHTDPWIKISIKSDKNHLHIYITDSGPGIKSDLIDKIFVPMFTSKPVGKGTGLGLSLSKSFMNQNMGDLVYETVNDHTCFIVSLLKGIKETREKAS